MLCDLRHLLPFWGPFQGHPCMLFVLLFCFLKCKVVFAHRNRHIWTQRYAALPVSFDCKWALAILLMSPQLRELQPSLFLHPSWAPYMKLTQLFIKWSSVWFRLRVWNHGIGWNLQYSCAFDLSHHHSRHPAPWPGPHSKLFSPQWKGCTAYLGSGGVRKCFKLFHSKETKCSFWYPVIVWMVCLVAALRSQKHPG